MITTRQIDRFWSTKSYDRLFRDLIAIRPEASFRAQSQLTQPFATAALGLIRLHELSQDHTPTSSTLLRSLLSTQHSDGGWSDPLTTSLCLRALLAPSGFGGTDIPSGFGGTDIPVCYGAVSGAGTPAPEPSHTPRRPSGLAITRALTYLSTLQKPEGIWPAIPLRRLPADPYASAFILYQLADFPEFRSAVRFADAIHWFEFNEQTLDPETRALWQRARTRSRLGVHLTQLAESGTK